MFTETEKEVLVEYPVDVVYETLVSVFPVKYYDMVRHNPRTRSVKVIDSFNMTFVMDITLMENTAHTTVIRFTANYPHALMDMTEGGKQAIECVLEELLNQLDKKPKTGTAEALGSDVEVVDADNFVNTTKEKKHTTGIVVGYVLCILSIVLPVYAMINYDPADFVMFMFFMVGILCLAMEISLSVVLQYYEDSSSIFHGRIQLCLCGLSMIVLGIILHPSLIIAGIIIPVMSIYYFMKREKSAKLC